MIDRVNTTGTLFLGLTVACAQCHSHKTDPITQRDYYRLYAFFNSASMTDLDLASPRLRTRREAMQKQADGVKEKMSQCATSLARNLAEWEQQLTDEERRILSPSVQQLLAIAPDRRTDEQTQQLVTARIERDAQHRQLVSELDRLNKQMPKLPTTPVMHHTGGETHLFLRGNHEQLGERVGPGVPSFLSRLTDSDSRTRVELAQWLTARENPLTARVAMNRLWQRDFGRGLVDTENDFGIQTAPPSHPDLLDWLASEFLDGGGRMKRMHRLIVSSATYRQSSTLRPELLAADPENRWLARQRRFRLEAEILRDSSLAVAGALSSKIGGPSVFPQQPDGVLDYRATKANWVISTGEGRYRRGMYTWFWRLTPHPMLTLFDAPDGTAACTRRDRSNTPVQALTLLNDPLFVDGARMLAARRMCRRRPGTSSSCIPTLFGPAAEFERVESVE